MDNDYSDLISKVFYNRTSLEYGEYKVQSFIELRGKSKIPYFLVKFKNTSNYIEAPLKTILEDRVIDIEAKKKQTKKVNKKKKKDTKTSKKYFKSNIDLENPIILALDLATISTGYAVYKDSKPIDYGYIFQTSKENLTVRINGMKKEIENIIEKYNINCIVVENVLMSLGNSYDSKPNMFGQFEPVKPNISKILYALSKLHGVILDVAYEMHIPVRHLEPREWKTHLDILRFKHITHSDKRIQSKLRTIEAVKNDLSIDVVKLFKGRNDEEIKKRVFEDVCDSLGIGYVFIKYFLNQKNT